MIRKGWDKNRIALRSKRFWAMVTMLSMLTGCGVAGEGAENIVLIEKETEAIVYDMAVVTIADVVKTEKVKCVYQQVNDEQVSFDVGGKRIDKVYVEKGDTVKKGQLLATLDTGNAADAIETLEYRIARNELTLSYSQINEDNELSSLWLNHIYFSI